MLQRRELLSMSAMAALTAMRVPGIWVATLDSTYKGVKLGLITGTLTPLPNVPVKDPIDVTIDNCLAVGRCEHRARERRWAYAAASRDRQPFRSGS